MRYCPFCLSPCGDDARACPRDKAATVSTEHEARARSLLHRTLDEYRVTRPIARGGMGEVYEAVHTGLGRRVAVKVLTAENQIEDVKRFFNEARSASLIRHENVVEVLDTGTLPDRRPYLVMELLEGQTLGQALRARPAPPLVEVGRTLLPVLDAIQAAHATGILHRDLKPDNIFLARRGDAVVPKVLDFGIAKHALADGLTTSGTVLGTPRYMAPEQARGLTLDARTDVYAMGIILFEMCCGRLPFEADAYAELLLQHVMAPPPKPRTLRPDLTGPVEAVILTAIAKEPAERWATAQEMAQALHGSLVNAGVPAEELPSPGRRAGKWATIVEAPALVAVAPEPPPSQPTMRAAAAEVLTPRLRRRSRRAAVLAAIGVMGGAAAAVGTLWLFAGGTGDPPEPGEESRDEDGPRRSGAREAPERDGAGAAGLGAGSVAATGEAAAPESRAAEVPESAPASAAAASGTSAAPEAGGAAVAPPGPAAPGEPAKAKATRPRGSGPAGAKRPAAAAKGVTATAKGAPALDKPVSPDAFDADLKKRTGATAATGKPRRSDE